jgi:hypothetical protein
MLLLVMDLPGMVKKGTPELFSDNSLLVDSHFPLR